MKEEIIYELEKLSLDLKQTQSWVSSLRKKLNKPLTEEQKEKLKESIALCDQKISRIRKEALRIEDGKNRNEQ